MKTENNRDKELARWRNKGQKGSSKSRYGVENLKRLEKGLNKIMTYW